MRRRSPLSSGFCDICNVVMPIMPGKDVIPSLLEQFSRSWAERDASLPCHRTCWLQRCRIKAQYPEFSVPLGFCQIHRGLKFQQEGCKQFGEPFKCAYFTR